MSGEKRQRYRALLKNPGQTHEQSRRSSRLDTYAYENKRELLTKITQIQQDIIAFKSADDAERIEAFADMIAHLNQLSEHLLTRSYQGHVDIKTGMDSVQSLVIDIHDDPVINTHLAMTPGIALLGGDDLVALQSVTAQLSQDKHVSQSMFSHLTEAQAQKLEQQESCTAKMSKIN